MEANDDDDDDLQGTWVLWVGGYLYLREKLLAAAEKRVCRTLGPEVGKRLHAADEAHEEDMRSLRQEVKELRERLAARIDQQHAPARPID